MDQLRKNYILSDENLISHLKSTKGLMLLLLTSNGDGLCYLMETALFKLPKHIKDRLAIYRMDAEVNRRTVKIYRILNIPTLLFFKAGQLVDEVVGLSSKNKIISKIQLYL